jgi:hypothetical protein
MIRLSSPQEAAAAVAGAREVEVLAYTLRRGPVLDALERAARCGVRVRVRLEGAPFADPRGALARLNRTFAGELAACGAEVRLAGARDAQVHAKAIVADGVLYLDNRNWGAGDLVVCDSGADDVAGVRDAFDGRAGDAKRAPLAVEKRDAVAGEAALLRAGAGDGDVVVESETFGFGPVCSALEALAAAGASPRLLVCEGEAASSVREREALERLAADGVQVRVCRSTEKFALAGGRAWIGSANASPAFGQSPTLDWGLSSNDPAIVGQVRARIEAHWAAARPFRERWSKIEQLAGVPVGNRFDRGNVAAE